MHDFVDSQHRGLERRRTISPMLCLAAMTLSRTSGLSSTGMKTWNPST